MREAQREKGSTKLPFASIEACPAAIAAPAMEAEAAAAILDVVQAELVWGGDVLSLAHLPARKRVIVRELGLAIEELDDLVIARIDDGRLALCLPNGALVPPGYRLTIPAGGAVLRVTLVADDCALEPESPTEARNRRRFAAVVWMAAAVQLAAIAMFMLAPVTSLEDEATARAAIGQMLRDAETRAAYEAEALRARSVAGEIADESRERASSK